MLAMGESVRRSGSKRARVFEHSPVGRPGISPETVLHQWLREGWGILIEDQFDLERPADHWKRTGR